MRNLITVSLFLTLVSCGVTPVPAMTLDSRGGTVASADGVVTLGVPAGALSSSATFTFTRAENLPAAPAGQKLVPGTAYNVQGTVTPSAPLSLKLKYDATQLAGLDLKTQANDASLALYFLLAGQWQQVPGFTVDRAQSLVSALVSQYGTYALMASVSTVPAITRIDLTPLSASTLVGDGVQFSAVARDQSGAAVSPQPVFTWTSSDPSKATINSAGRAVGVAAGETQITASAAGVRSQVATLTVRTSGSGGAYTVTELDQKIGNLEAHLNTPGSVLYRNVRGHMTLITSSRADLPALPGDFVLSYLPPELASSCLTDRDNVFLVADNDKSGTDKRVVLFFYDVASGQYTQFALPESMSIGGCTSQNTVLLNRINSPEASYLWTPGQASLTPLALPASETGPLVGYRPTDLLDDGTVLLPGGLLRGTAFTKIINPQGSGTVSARGITSSGVVYGDLGGSLVFRWKEGEATATSLGRPPVPSDDRVRVRSVNNKGELLVVTANSRGLVQFWLYRGGAYELVQVSGYTLTDMGTLNDSGWIVASGYTGTTPAEKVLLLKP